MAREVADLNAQPEILMAKSMWPNSQQLITKWPEVTISGAQLIVVATHSC